MKKIKFKTISKPINSSQLNRLIKILKLENQSSILANLSKINIDKYLREVIKSKNLKLFVATKKKHYRLCNRCKKTRFFNK